MKLEQRFSRWLGVALMLGWLAVATARAGQPMYAFLPNDEGTDVTSDDKYNMTQLKWHDGADVKFYLAHTSDGGVFYAAANTNDLSVTNVVNAIDRALLTWNNARWGKFKFDPSLGDTRNAPKHTYNYVSYQPSSAFLDGYNVITFLDATDPVTNDVGTVRLAYFQKDLDLTNLDDNATLLEGVNIINVPGAGDSATLTGGTATVASYSAIDMNNDGIYDLYIPTQKYSAGDIFDCDIVLSPTVIPTYLQTWPENESDVPSGTQTAGTLDVQAVFTYLFGQARGIANSMIEDASMYPYFNGPATTTSIYEEQPYRRRVLSFDDQLAVGIADGKSMSDSSLGAISGNVIDGNVMYTTTQGPTYTYTNQSEMVVQAPMFLCVRPEVQNASSLLLSGRAALDATQSPDDLTVAPLDTASGQTGTWRRVAQVLTGQNLQLAITSGVNTISLANAGNVAEITKNISDLTTQPGGLGTADATTSNSVTIANGDTLNSAYYFAGLPSTTDAGTTINYAVRLQAAADSTVQPDTAYNYYQSTRASSTSTGSTYPDEFYGGVKKALTYGKGTVKAATSISDNYYSNYYLEVQVNENGRFAAKITDGLPILSGWFTDPSSYFTVTSSQGTFSNHDYNIGIPTNGMNIDDTNETSKGIWTQEGNFRILQQTEFTDSGSAGGIPRGIKVTYIVTNLGGSTATFSLRQVLDTYAMGLENPVYVNGSATIDNAITVTGSAIPTTLNYQSSVSNPAMTGFIDMQGYGLTKPSSVTIADMSDLLAYKTFSKGGYSIHGIQSVSSDTGVCLQWTKELAADGVATISFDVGYSDTGEIYDGWATMNSANFEAGTTAPGDDDPEEIKTITVSPGQTRDDITIFTNTAPNSTASTTNQSNGQLLFVEEDNAFPDTDYVQTCAAMADFDGDGYLDVVVGGVHGGSDPIASAINRLYKNERKIQADGSTKYYFEDVTFGPDGIQGTDDDNLPNTDNNTLGVAVADFDLDGHPDIFFSNVSDTTTENGYYSSYAAPNQMLINDGTGKFNDESPQWLGEGLLGRGGSYDEDSYENGLGWDDSGRVAVGDINGDGAPDLIISERAPFSDELYDSAGNEILPPSRAWVDVGPRNLTYPNGDNKPNSIDDMWSTGLLWTERVLINMTRVPEYQLHSNYYTKGQGNYFTDQTLGADHRAGVMTNFADPYWDMNYDITDNYYTTHLNIDPTTTDHATIQNLGDCIDRMPPVMPAMWGANYNTPTPSVSNLSYSPMGAHAYMPILGAFFGSTCLDLASIRMYRGDYNVNNLNDFQDVITPFSSAGASMPSDAFINRRDQTIREDTITGVAYSALYAGTENAFFRNSDVFTNNWSHNPDGTSVTGYLGQDGINDGYFVCVNYNMDWGLTSSSEVAYRSSDNPTSYTGLPQPMYPMQGNIAPYQTMQVGLNGPNVPAGLAAVDGLFNSTRHGGLFVYMMCPNDSATTGTEAYYQILSDVMPLFIGMPSAYPANTVTTGFVNTDLFAPVNGNLGMCGMIADWYNEGAPRPLILPYPLNSETWLGMTGSNPYVYHYATSSFATSSYWPAGIGFWQHYNSEGDAGYNVDYANAYFTGSLTPYAAWTANQALTAVPITPLTDYPPMMAVHGDFDRDGDEDFFVARSVTGIGTYTSGNFGAAQVGLEATNQLFAGDGSGNFVDVSATGISPNPNESSMYVVSGDVDLDGDEDLVVINSGTRNRLYMNQTFTAPPDFESDDDAKMFYEASAQAIPPIGGLQIGQTVRAAVGDLDGDGYPDLALANGGSNSTSGDFVEVYFNRGNQSMYAGSSHRTDDGCTIFQPAGSDHPAPMLNNLYGWGLLNGADSIFNIRAYATSLYAYSYNGAGADFNGLLSEPIFQSTFSVQLPYDYYNDVELGDIDKDGALDLVTIATSPASSPQGLLTGPVIYRNVDSKSLTNVEGDYYRASDNTNHWFTGQMTNNALPDTDSKGDGLMQLDASAIPALIDRQNFSGANQTVLKKQGRKAVFADVNGDGYLDLIVANGTDSGGAPNLLLLNQGSAAPGKFTDVTDGDDHYLPVTTYTNPYNSSQTAQVGVLDDTVDVAAGDFSCSGHIDLVFINKTNAGSSVGFRYLHNDGTGHFTEEPDHFLDEDGNPTDFAGTSPTAVAIGQFDGIGEVTNDKNFNGVLDPGEDTNGDGQIDWVVKPTETEDIGVFDTATQHWSGAGNGVVTSANDTGIIGSDGTSTGAGNGKIDTYDRNNDGVVTAYRSGYWNGFLDLFVTFDDGPPRVLINDPTGKKPGYFYDKTSTLFPDGATTLPSRGVAVGDVDNNGTMDVVEAIYRGGVVCPVRLWENTTVSLSNGKVRRGVFKDRSSEVPATRAWANTGETGASDTSENAWASDVKLVDIDNDGDLDMIVTGLGRTNGTASFGSCEMVYMNRLIGSGFNHVTQANTTKAGTPTVASAVPAGANRGKTVEVMVYGQNMGSDVAFAFGSGVTVTSVESVRAYNPVDETGLVDIKNMSSGTANSIYEELRAQDASTAQSKYAAMFTSGVMAKLVVVVDAGATLGARGVSVYNESSGGVSTKMNAFTVLSTSSDSSPGGSTTDSSVPQVNWTLYR